VLPPKPNYQKDVLEVYTDFLEWVIFSRKSLDIICRRWAQAERSKPGGRKNPTPIVKLPSWIQYLPPGYQEQSYNGPIYGGSIVGKTSRKSYNASYGKEPDVQFGKRGRSRQRLAKQSRAHTAPANMEESFATTTSFTQSLGPPGKQTVAHRLYAHGIEIGFVSWTFGPVSRGVIPKECLPEVSRIYPRPES